VPVTDRLKLADDEKSTVHGKVFCISITLSFQSNNNSGGYTGTANSRPKV